jgi:hypothetical protein
LTLTKEAIKSSLFDCLELSKAAPGKAVEATFKITIKTPQGGGGEIFNSEWVWDLLRKA